MLTFRPALFKPYKFENFFVIIGETRRGSLNLEPRVLICYVVAGDNVKSRILVIFSRQVYVLITEVLQVSTEHRMLTRTIQLSQFLAQLDELFI